MVRIYGARAALQVLSSRAGDVVRGYFSESRGSAYRDAMRSLAEARVAYRVVPEADLDRVTQSRHHEGICLLTKPRDPMEVAAWVKSLPPASLVVILDGIGNPHNLGGIVRSAAHFGARGVWVASEVSPNQGAMARVAEGAAERIDVQHAPTLVPVLVELARSGFEVVGATPRGDVSLFQHRFARRTAMVFGSEREGLSIDIEAQLEVRLRVPGTGLVESLNVASAASVMMSEFARQRATKTRR